MILRQRELRFSNGVVANYDALVSSVPLPDLIPMIKGAPPDVREAAQRLACSTCVLVNVGVNRAGPFAGAHDLFLRRRHLLHAAEFSSHAFSREMSHRVPAASRQKSTFPRQYKPLTNAPEEWIEPVIKDLHRCGLLREEDKILFKQRAAGAARQRHFRSRTSAALKTVHGYLDDIGIAYCGRYGDWGYMWTDESFKSGEQAAEKALTACVV